MRALRFAVAPALVTPILAAGSALLMMLSLLWLGRRAIALGFTLFQLFACLRRGTRCRLAVAIALEMRFSGALAIMAIVLLAPLLTVSFLRVRPVAFALIGLTLSVPGCLVLVALTVMLRPVGALAIAIPAPMTLRAAPGLTFGPFKFGLWPAKPPNLLKFYLGAGCRLFPRCSLLCRRASACHLGGSALIGLSLG